MGRPPRPAAVIESERSRLIELAERIVANDGAGALTMRRLAADAGSGIGLVYRLFEDRDEIVFELLRRQTPAFNTLADEAHELPGRNSVAANLDWITRQLLAVPSAALAVEQLANPRFLEFVASEFVDQRRNTTEIVQRYLAAEQAQGRVGAAVDVAGIAQALAAVMRDHVLTGRYRIHSDERLVHMVRAIALSVSTEA